MFFHISKGLYLVALVKNGDFQEITNFEVRV